MRPDDLGERVHRELTQLPAPRAPRTLLPRVLAAIQREPRPWYGLPWVRWPGVWQGLSVAALGGLVLGFSLVSPGIDADVVGEVTLRTNAWTGEALAHVRAARVLWRVLLEPYMVPLFALVTVMCAASAVFGGALTNVLREGSVGMMRTLWSRSGAWAIALILVAASAGAQLPEAEQPAPEVAPPSPEAGESTQQDAEPAPEAVEPPPADEETSPGTQAETEEGRPESTRPSPEERRRTRNGVVRIGDSYTVAAGDRVREVVVIAGSATIEGDVDGDVVVVLGAARLAGTSVVGGDFVVVGGSATIEPGAVVDRDVVVVGGELDAPPGFSSGGEHVAIGFLGSGVPFDALGPWFSQGLLWGRPLVPSLPWMWAFVGVIFLMYLIINIVFERPVRACSEVLADKPLTTGFAGFLVLLLFGPVSFLLLISVVGMVVLPFLMLALLIGGILGRIGVVRWLGGRVVAEHGEAGWGQATRSLTIGFVIVTLAYMVPVIGLVTWAVLGVFGLGAATTTFVAALRRELPPASQPPPISVPANAPPATPLDATVEHAAETAATDVTILSGTTMNTDGALLQRATFPRRFGAVVLDLLLVMVTMMLLPLEGAGAFFFLVLVYHVVFWGWKGTTIGGLICRLRIVRTEGAPIRFSEAVIRGLSGIFSVAALGLGWFWAIGDAEGQAWHDRVAGTYVVSVPPDWPLP